VNTPHDAPNFDNAPADPDDWWARLADRINDWWVLRQPTGPALLEMAAIPPKRAVAAILAAVLAVLALAVSLLWWLVSGIVGIVTGVADAIRTSSGHSTTNAVNDLTTWSLTRTITDPVHAYLTAHSAGLPATADLLWWTWLSTTGALFLLAALGSRGARIGWAITGLLTTAMVYTATPATGRPVAAGLTITAWAVLSVIAYNRLAPLDHPIRLSIPIAQRPAPTDTTN
jgi:hypothetical protein